ncbi:hypothetical protein EJ02DRAFT_329252, partial [Clathrospora elynae]
SLVTLTLTHSWVERLHVVKDGLLIGPPGYPRGNVIRIPSFRVDNMTYRLPPAGQEVNEIWASDLVCKEPQIIYNQTIGSPGLSAQANDTVILLYQENGHVTKIANDPGHANSGIVSVFGKLDSMPADTLQSFTIIENQAQSPYLLETASFDDGACYQDNGTPTAKERKLKQHRAPLSIEGPDLWCGISARLPTNLQPGNIYTLVWIWNFNGIGFVETYTSCIDVVI